MAIEIFFLQFVLAVFGGPHVVGKCLENVCVVFQNGEVAAIE